MASKKFESDTIIANEGDSLDKVLLIMDGEVESCSGSFRATLGKSDVIGLCGKRDGVSGYTYTAISDVSVYEYPFEDIDSLDSILSENADIGYMFVKSAATQIAKLARHKKHLSDEAHSIYNVIHEFSDEYTRLCGVYGYTASTVPGLDELKEFEGDLTVTGWIDIYYDEIGALAPNTLKSFFHGNPGIGKGFLIRCVDDYTKLMDHCKPYHEYLQTVTEMLLCTTGNDLFSYVSDLHMSTISIEGADFAIEALMVPLCEKISQLPGISKRYYQDRMHTYWDELETKRDAPSMEGTDFFGDFADEPEAQAKQPSDSQDEQQTNLGNIPKALDPALKSSLKTILDYSGCDKETAEKFSELVKAFTDLPDRSSTDDDIPDLRRDLSKAFYVIYRHVFLKTLKDDSPPTVIKMFLNFGYVDADLAGHENAGFLYSIADSFKGDSSNGVYTIAEWLRAIYEGKREPSLSEFDMDFTEYVRDLKKQKQIDAAEEKKLLANQDEKLKYEMENAFPVVNRVTFGNPTKFCAPFADHNVIRKLSDTLVTADFVKETIEEIRGIDYSVFFREQTFSDTKTKLVNEIVNVEVTPNIILMPNVGIRGSMWQEIEGRVRTTPARMFMPVFLENDKRTIIMRLIADFRWELCKRMQGTRWNDMTSPSLTSYYCDYLQFYMNDRSIAMQTMTDIRNELSSARNNYKTVFINNYVMWIQNESKGMSRLNNIAVKHMMRFCPFVAPIRKKLENNARYREGLNVFNVNRKKREQRLVLLVKKIRQSGKEVPPEIMRELDITKM